MIFYRYLNNPETIHKAGDRRFNSYKRRFEKLPEIHLESTKRSGDSYTGMNFKNSQERTVYLQIFSRESYGIQNYQVANGNSNKPHREAINVTRTSSHNPNTIVITAPKTSNV